MKYFPAPPKKCGAWLRMRLPLQDYEVLDMRTSGKTITWSPGCKTEGQVEPVKEAGCILISRTWRHWLLLVLERMGSNIVIRYLVQQLYVCAGNCCAGVDDRNWQIVQTGQTDMHKPVRWLCQNANWTSPLRSSRRDDRNAYVERLIWSSDERFMTSGRLDTGLNPVRPVQTAQFEFGVVFLCGICMELDSWWDKTSPPYKYKGPRPIGYIQSIKTYQSITFRYFALLFVFPKP